MLCWHIAAAAHWASSCQCGWLRLSTLVGGSRFPKITANGPSRRVPSAVRTISRLEPSSPFALPDPLPRQSVPQQTCELCLFRPQTQNVSATLGLAGRYSCTQPRALVFLRWRVKVFRPRAGLLLADTGWVPMVGLRDLCFRFSCNVWQAQIAGPSQQMRLWHLPTCCKSAGQ